MSCLIDFWCTKLYDTFKIKKNFNIVHKTLNQASKHSCYSYNTELDRSGFPCGKHYYYYHSMQWIFLIAKVLCSLFHIPHVTYSSMCKECNDKRIMSPKTMEEDGNASGKSPTSIYKSAKCWANREYRWLEFELSQKYEWWNVYTRCDSVYEFHWLNKWK